MMHRLLKAGFAGVVLGAFAGAALAAAPLDVTGTWTGVVTLPNGTQLPFIAHLKQSGQSVSGVLDGINGAPDVPIRDGKVAGSRLTFTGVRTIRGQAVTFEYTVTPAGGDGLRFPSRSRAAAPGPSRAARIA